ncbi:MAG: BON domain-containing protein [Steroidobacteraceae bacterium]|jgi:hypothetical protein|nr:BON domain-containing protein [Steroidobacteraceae bacterium]
MAFRDFFRGDRDREEEERERWARGGEWRDERDEHGRWTGRREQPPGSEFTDHSSESYGAGYGRERGAPWSHGGRRYSQDYGRRDYGRDYGRESERYSGSYYGGDYGRERGERGGDWRGEQEGSSGGGHAQYGMSRRESGGSWGEGGYGREMDYGRGALGYGGYGASSGREWSWRQSAREDHRGKGPRGYRRSDERIREDVCDCLTEDPLIDASDMEVTVKDGEVTLSGRVGAREEKRRAEDLIERIGGVRDVNNMLRVSPPTHSDEGGVAASGARH